MARYSQAIDGGLDIAVKQALGGEQVWHCEQDPAASAVLAHHWPTVPNLGDITAVKWSTVEPVDILTGGFPCQDISFAGRGAGIEGARSGLWRYLADAVRVLRPGLVVLENVSAVLVRGLDRVLADLAFVGYDVRWTCLRASDVGAPHRRNRWFAIAYPADTPGPRWGWHEPERVGTDSREADGTGEAESGRRDRGAADSDGERPVRPWDSRGRLAGLAYDGDASADPEGDGRHERRPEPAGQLGGLDTAVSGDAAIPDTCGIQVREQSEPVPGCGGTSVAGRNHASTAHPRCDTRPQDNQDRAVAAGSSEQRRLDSPGRVLDWGQYEPAIRRWEYLLGQSAPEPTVVGRRGGRQLNPAFVEWMMGVPGHITSVPGLSRNDMLRLAGNGVVPQQGAAALRWLLTATEERAA